MGGFLYFWRQYETSISGSTEKRIRCVGCSHVFEYEITREGFGRGDSPFNLSNAEAAANARKRAQADLSQALSEGIEPIHCTSCGIFQPDMVRLLRERHGKHLDPNKYASDRIITIPIEEAIKQALRAANAENTVKSYTKFLETWPYSFYGSWAKEKIKERRRPYLRWILSHLEWIVWWAVVIGIIGGLIVAVIVAQTFPS